MNIKVSVVIPTYKRSTSLERAINSLIDQTYKNIEIIVVDDNDPLSDYRKKVKKIIDKYKETKIIYSANNQNIGSAKSRNVGILKSTGEYITFLDDDDIYEPEKIKRQLSHMVKNNLEMCFTNLISKNEKGKIVFIRSRKDITAFDTNTLLKYHLMHHITGTSTFMYKSQTLKNLGGFEPIDIGDEYYLMQKTILNGTRIGYIDSNDTIAYIHGTQGGLSTGNSKIEGENRLFEFKKKHFVNLTSSERRYVNFRHNAVLAYVYIKNRSYVLALKHTFLTLASSPLSVIKLLFSSLKNKKLSKLTSE